MGLGWRYSPLVLGLIRDKGCLLRGVHGIQVAVHMHVRCADDVHFMFKGPKCPSLFQVESNKTSRDVKGLFLGVRFVLRRVMVISWLGCSSRTSCMSRWGVVLKYVMGLMGLGWRYSPLVLGLIRDKGRLLRGQVSLAWESSKPLYIKRGVVSI